MDCFGGIPCSRFCVLAQVMALQASASLQRCHSDFWVQLSHGYKKLEETLLQDGGLTSAQRTSPSSSKFDCHCEAGLPALSQEGQLHGCPSDCVGSSSVADGGTARICLSKGKVDNMGRVAYDTFVTISPGCSPPECVMALEAELRPHYISYIGLNAAGIEGLDSDNVKQTSLLTAGAAVHNSKVKGIKRIMGGLLENHKEILIRTVQLFRPYFSWREKVADGTGDNGCVPCGRGYGCARLAADNCDCRIHGNTSPCTAGKFEGVVCTKDCVFHSVPVQDSSLYSQTLLHALNGSCVPHTLPSLVPHLGLPLCFSHSPFVLLVRRVLLPEELVRVVRELCALSQCHVVACQLLASVYAMAACSCLVWARSVGDKMPHF